MLDRKDAYSAIPQLEKKIDAISTAQEEAGLNYDAFREETRQELDVISGELVGVVTNMLQIESSNGLIFKDGIETTRLNVTIYRGSEVISNYEQLTAQLGYTAYLRWSYLTDTGYVEIPASDSRLSNDSFTLTLSTADVTEKTTFKCELMLEGSGNLAELLAANQITIAKVLDGEMSAEQLAQLNQASTDASQAKTDANNAQTSINNLEIGGRNLILNSETKKISKYKDTITTETGITVSEWGTKNAFRTYGTCSISTTFGILTTGSSSPTSASGQAYVHSIYVKNNGGTAIYITNNGIGETQIIQPGESKRAILYGTGTGVKYLQINFVSSNLGDAFDVTYWRPKIEIGNKATDWTPAPEDVDAGIANAQATADEAQEYVLGVQTFEYILDGVTIPAHKRADGTYYYILNDAEVTVAEADLVHDADGDLVSYQEGGIYEDLNDISNNIDAIDTKVDGFNAREDAIYKSIQDNSLIARKNARVEENSIIITNDTTTKELLNYLQLDADAITIYGEGDQIVTIAKYGGNSGYMEMAGTSLLIAQESRLSTIRLRSADRIGNLAFVAGSDGHVSLREVLD